MKLKNKMGEVVFKCINLAREAHRVVPWLDIKLYTFEPYLGVVVVVTFEEKFPCTEPKQVQLRKGHLC